MEGGGVVVRQPMGYRCGGRYGRWGMSGGRWQHAGLKEERTTCTADAHSHDALSGLAGWRQVQRSQDGRR